MHRDQDERTASPARSLPATDGGQSLPSHDSAALFCGARHALIRHGGDVYRLSITRQNRLILTK